MTYVLKSDGTFDNVKHLTQENGKDGEFYLFDISTERKGPLYTLVKDVSYTPMNEKLKIEMDTAFASIDAPWDDNMKLSSVLNITTIESMYNIYPLIKQMLEFNTFHSGYESIDNQIMIEFVSIQLHNSVIEISEDTSDKKIKNIFKSFRMITGVDKYLKNRYLILNKNQWKIINDSQVSDYTFEKIGVPVTGSESLYLMTMKEFYLFHQIKSVEVNFSYVNRFVYENYMYNTDDESDIDSCYCVNSIELSSFDDILKMCIYIPQMILLEHAIYNEDIGMHISLETKNRILNLSITEKETTDAKNTCLYNIIKKLLQM